MLIEIVTCIDTRKVLNFISTPHCGGMNIFIGNVRDSTNGKKVLFLDFECYKAMAITQIKLMAAEAKQKFSLKKVAIQHVVGRKYPSEQVIIIGVSAKHRKECFLATRFLIDTLKKTVPIWKKEYFENGSVWVNTTP